MFKAIKGVLKKEFIYMYRSPKGTMFEILLPIINIIPLLLTVCFLNNNFGNAAFVEYTNTNHMNNYYCVTLLGLVFINLSESSGYLLEREMYFGTLEQIWLAPNSSRALIFGWYIFLALKSLLHFMIFMGISFFMIDISIVNFPLLLILLLILMIFAFGLGVIIEAITLYFRQADAIVSTIMGLIPILSCVSFPINVLHPVVQQIAKLLPTTYLFDLIKHSLAGSRLIFDMQVELMVVVASSVLFVIISFRFYYKMYKKAKKCGMNYL